ncbi:hypothetical protein ACFYN9_17470 [Streptomyces collinus]|uniref:Uncharacterized protein n=2 Tax=Streptomyces collinus TaxID=42684 RepID=A0AA89TJW0_STRCU|nr:hypothetical protein [Streptomyces collinus]MBB5814794.1 hypothetical protein [Streptomyces collinus]WMX67779.1 hypothetical protein RFN52_32250 [Streptomyces collinus]
MACPTGNPIVDIAVGFFSFLGDPIGTIVEGVANAVLAGAIAVFGALTTGIPTLSGTTTARDINSQTQWIVVYLAVGSLLFASARMAIERRGTAGTTALKGIMRVVLVSGAATTVVTAAAALSDDYSTYLFNAGAEKQLSAVGACSDGNGIEAFLLLVLAFLLLIAGIIHTILLYIRLGVMILLLGTLPLAAAASMTDWGGGWWRKHLGWMIAWLLYKPAAGLVLYAGSAMISSGRDGGSDINERIAGIGVMLLSAVALPALLKLVVPATAALGGASAMSGAMSTVGGSLASGARSLGSSGGSGGQSGPRGASGASGSGGSGGSQGSGGTSGAPGAPGPGGAGRPGASGAGAGGGSGAAAGAGRAAAAAGGPVGVAVGAAVTAAQIAGRTASGSLEGADPDKGHNT